MDVIEICGGTGFVSRICVRRKCRVGPNFDIVCGSDLRDKNEQWTLWYYLERGVMVAVMSPPCTPYGRFSSINMYNARDSWLDSYAECQPLAILCGEVALYQLQQGRGFVNENPAGSKLYHEPPWRKVAEFPGVHYAMVDQCMAGLTNSKGMPIRKRTELWASDEALIRHAAEFQCDGGHEHATLEGKEETSKARFWPWAFAVSIANGIMDYIAWHAQTLKSISAFPGAAAAAPLEDHGPWSPPAPAPARRRRLSVKTTVPGLLRPPVPGESEAPIVPPLPVGTLLRPPRQAGRLAPQRARIK